MKFIYNHFKILIFLFFCLVVIFIATSVRRERHSSYSMVLLEIQKLETAIMFYKLRNGTFPITVTSETEQDISDIRRLLSYGYYYYDNEDRYEDLWGNPYHICFDMDGDHMIRTGNRIFHGDMAIWSDGWNQTDEFGEGDDIIDLFPK